jgi:CheY-like chemotaxis protein
LSRNERTAQKAIASLKILLADDEPTNLHLAKTILAMEGHSVVACCDGEEVLDRVGAGETFDLFVIDLVMPQRDGYSTIGALRQMGVRTPIVVISASVFEDCRLRALEIGANGFVGKPYRRSELLEAIVEANDGLTRACQDGHCSPSGARSP